MDDRILGNLESVLTGAGASLCDIVKTTVYLCDPEHFREMNGAYERAIEHKPARTTVIVAGLPLGAQIEIDCVARRP